MKIFSLRLVVGLILQMEYVCLLGLIKFTDGSISVRLVNPSSSESNPSAGRLEVRRYYDTQWTYSEWGTVCDDGFTAAAARVVCSSLGFSRAGSVITNSFGVGYGAIWLDDVVCTGTETGIGSCSHGSWGLHNCAHYKDVAIDCDGCSGGRAQCDLTTTTCVDTFGSYYCPCKNGYTYSTSTSCTDINECNNGQHSCNLATTTCINTVGSYYCSCKNSYVYLTSTSCTDINECTSRQHSCDLATTTCENTVGSYQCSCKNGYVRYTSTSCTGYIYARLVNPGSSESNPSAGRLEVRRYYDAWGTVCDDEFTAAAARVVCSSLGFSRAGSVIRNSFGEGSGEIWLDDVVCTSAEPYIGNCSHRPWGQDDCSHREDVAIDCDECSSGRARCDLTTTRCVDTVGSYSCSCMSGYTHSTSTSCRDVDECERGEHLCDNSTTICINSDGSYHCVCRTGYERENGTLCSDINECVSGESECDLMSTDCINTIGNYTCGCRNGFTYFNETTCVEKLLKVIVGSSVGTFLAVALIAILLTFFYWKRRKTLQTEPSVVDNGSGVEYSTQSNIYIPLKKPESNMTGKGEIYVQLDASTRLPVPKKKPKKTAESAVDENTQSAIYGNVQSTVETVQSAIDEDGQFSANDSCEFPIYENARK